MKLTDEIKFWLQAGGITLLVAAAVLYAMLSADYSEPRDSFRLEAAKLVLQFLLVGVGGALVLAYLNHRRDQAEKVAIAKMAAAASAADARAAAQGRAAVRRSALQELIRQIGDAHRRLKVVKRQLRAAIAREEPDPKDPPTRPYRVPAASFERAMDALLSAQISTEEVRDRIAMSIELLDRDQLGRIRAALHYGARYFHDVYQDYEHCRIKRDDDYFIITPVCNNIHNFLFARDLPTDLPAADVEELLAQFDVMHEEGRALDERHQALMKIDELRKRDGRKRRYRTIAAEGFTLAADELRWALWKTCPAEEAAAAAAASNQSQQSA